MSRLNVTKSRADKAGTKTTQSSTPVVHDIVPGKFTIFDWCVHLMMSISEILFFGTHVEY